tara:strand:- start:6576 stop:7331 length:756 start_codon:yes stop_codon:yes gene_type:complete
MKKILLVFGKYPDERQKFFNTYMSPRNQEYADKHGFEYLELTENLYKYRGSYTWLKFTILEQMINEGYVKNGDIVTHFDADMCVVKTDVSYETSKSFSYVIDSGNTHCMGSYSIKINDWSKQLVANILSEERFNTLNDVKTRHDRFGTIDCFWHSFREQASWYSLAGIKRHSDEPFWNLPHNGWHSAKDEWTIYSLDELYEHVEILPTEFNVTEVEGESNCEFLINRVNNDDVIIRHFAGVQGWRKEWFDK